MVIPHNSGPWETSSHSHTSFDDVDFETHRYLTGKGDPRLPPILSDAPNGTHGQFNVRQRVNSLRSTQSIHGVQSIDPELMAVRRETEIQYKRAGATDKNDEALRLQKKARYSVEAERTEAGACHTKASTKMREAAIQKIAEAKRQKAEAQKRKMEAEKRKAEAQRNGEEARRREPEAYQKEQMAKRNEEAVRRRREEARRKEVDARRREDDARRRLDDAVRKEVLAREAETRLLEEVRTKEKERKSRPAQEKAMDHTLGIFRYECNEVTREADDATRLEATKADAAKRSAGFESAAPQRENWAHKERRWKQPEEREARFNHEPFVEQDWRREEKSHLDEKERDLRKDRERHNLGRTTEREPQNNTSAPSRFGTPVPHPPACPTSALVGNHTGVNSKPTFPDTRQPPMSTYTSAPRSKEGWVNVEEDRADQGGTKEGVSLEGSKSRMKERLESKRRAENSNPNFVPDSKKRSIDGAKATGTSRNTGTAKNSGRNFSHGMFQSLFKKGP